MNIYDEINLANPMPEDVRAHYGVALLDLYYGPRGPDYWRTENDDPDAPDYRFLDSCKVLTGWFDSVDWPGYCDEEGRPMSLDEVEQASEQGTTYYEVDLAYLKQIIFGALERYI
jgi:hypothetical protein